jgi:IS5 family transposase
VKNLFQYKNVRYKGLAKNAVQLYKLFALASLMMVNNPTVQGVNAP